MARYSGRYHKGASKDMKAEKRAEAKVRQLTADRIKESGPYVPAGPMGDTNW